MGHALSPDKRSPRTGQAVALLVMLAVIVVFRTAGTQALSAVAQTANFNGATAAVKLLKVEPVKGFIGNSFTISGDSLTPGKKVEFFWSSVNAGYTTKVLPDNVEYHERKYDETRISLGSGVVDAQGRVNLSLVAPEDFGEVHDIYAVVDGQDVARGGFRILRSATITPTEGPVGAPITVTVNGLSWRGFEHFMALRYDNKYTGEISAVTTKGSAVFQIRAAGPPGKHIIQLNNSTATAPGAYLNTQQSPQDYIYAHLDNKQEFRFVFNVTKDAGAPSDALEWPDSSRVARLSSHAQRTTIGAKPASSSRVTMNPPSGPILSRANVLARALPPDTEVGLFFVTARGNRMTPS